MKKKTALELWDNATESFNRWQRTMNWPNSEKELETSNIMFRSFGKEANYNVDKLSMAQIALGQ